MSLAELKSEVQKFNSEELSQFTRWLDEFTASQWDARLETDVANGRLSKLLAKADAEFEAGKCGPL